jgi:predicted ATPase
MGAVCPSTIILVTAVYGHVGQPDEGLRVLTETQAATQTRGEQFLEAERFRLTGEVLLAQSSAHQSAAETCLNQALDMARRPQAKSFELRAAVSLSRLWQQQGKQGEAHELLAPIYGWFAEGFDTADLQEAKALREALA